MTEEQIDNLEAGRELDALIAEKVFGWKCYKTKNPFDAFDKELYMMVNKGVEKGLAEVEELKRYSTDISAAFEVVEKMQKEEFWFCFHGPGKWTNGTHYHEQDEWRCGIQKGAIEEAALIDVEASSFAKTLPLAICKTALKAKVLIDE